MRLSQCQELLPKTQAFTTDQDASDKAQIEKSGMTGCGAYLQKRTWGSW